MTDVERLLDALARANVDFVVVGGVAMVLRGSSRLTVDVDLCYARDPANLGRVAAALAPFHPRLRGAPPDLPFLWDERTLASGLNFTLTTDLGAPRPLKAGELFAPANAGARFMVLSAGARARRARPSSAHSRSPAQACRNYTLEKASDTKKNFARLHSLPPHRKSARLQERAERTRTTAVREGTRCTTVDA